MRFGQVLLSFGLLTGAVMALGQGCQEPTQVTIELALDKKAQCREIATGTAITVGVEPSDTEARVESGFVTARTTDCDAVSGQIGTLVVTPTDPGRAAIVVVVGYNGNDPTGCKPPLYQGCIVARRRFAFAEHTRLRMPITIDPDCADVPCDAFSTCNRGMCFDSESSCTGDDCERPGELPDGAVDEASTVIPDASGFDTGPGDDSGNDSGTSTYCEGDNLVCNSATCTGPNPVCCGAPTPQCTPACVMPDTLCCNTAQCGAGFTCVRAANAPFGRCQGMTPDGGTTFCSGSNTMVCNGDTCTAGESCCTTGPGSCTGACGVTTDTLCCTDSQCPSTHLCIRAGIAPGSCQLSGIPRDSGVIKLDAGFVDLDANAMP
ncbi:MAG: repeat domain protein [Labilithrix sp.]|nr:repeat domain protein [Labilithrix sp.]